MNLNNELDQLLNYLEENLRQNSVEIKKSSIDDKVKEEVSDNTKKLIEECQQLYKDDISPIRKSSKFDVLKYESLLRSRLIEDYKKSQSYERPYIGVLEVVSACIRRVYYERSKYPVDVKQLFTFPPLYLIQKVGDTVHDCISDIYDFSETKKTIVSEKYRVKGIIDALKENTVFEIKTLDSYKFDHRYINEHYYQGLVYAYILNSEYGYSIDTVCVLYQFRDKLRVSPIPFDLPVDNKLAISFLSRANVLLNSLNRKEVPEPVGSTEEQCQYCLYKDNCTSSELKTQKPFKVKESKDSVFLLS